MTIRAIDIENLSKSFTPPLLELRKLLRKPGGSTIHALREITLAVEPGEVFGLVGRNGQGKTTLIKSTCGLLEPTVGRVRVFGHDTVSDVIRVKSHVGLVSADERTFYWRLSGRQNLAFFGQLHGIDGSELMRRIDELSEMFELGPLLDRNFQEYSTGNKQRLAIVRALLPRPPLLLLDEPTRSLDPISAEGLRKVIARWVSARAENTVLITTHNLAEVEKLCGRVAILSRGRIIECDSTAALVGKYLGKEHVRVTVAARPEDSWLTSVREQLGTITCSSATDGAWELGYERRVGDDSLDFLLRQIVSANLAVVACDTEHYGLQQILERVEADEQMREGIRP
jgi:ABC-2 type transport system ATP-binding protein